MWKSSGDRRILPSTILLFYLLFYSTIYYSTLPSTIILYHLLFYSTIYYSTLSSTIQLYHLLFYSIIYYSTLPSILLTILLYHLLLTTLSLLCHLLSTTISDLGSRIWNSLALCKGDFEGNLFRCSNIWTDSTMIEASLTTTSMIGPEIMEKKIIVKRFNTSVAQHFSIINITTIWNALPYDVVNSRTVNTFKNRLDAHWEGNPPDVQNNR